MYDWLRHTIWLGNPVQSWIAAAIGALIGYIVVYGVVRMVTAYLQKLSADHPKRTPPAIAAAIARATHGRLLALLAIVIALHSLHFGATVHDRLGWLIGALIGVLIAFWVSAVAISWFKRATPEGGMQKTDPIIYGIVTWAVRMAVWVTLLLILLHNAGVHIGAFIASLGVAGIAVAMAAKNMLEDLFAGISIGLDKPFDVGEFIMFGSELGTVKKVGIRSTRIESLSGEELAVSNSRLVQNLTHNYSRRQERRIVFGFHVPLDTPRDKVERVVNVVNAIIDAQGNIRRDRGFFVAIEPQGFRYEFVYYVLTSAYSDYVAAQQAINLRILDEFEAIGVTFAMPMRMMYRPEEREAAAA